MSSKNLKELPKLPKGMGSYSYEKNGDIRYRKMIQGKQISVSGSSITEVNNSMRIREEEVLKEIKLGIQKEKTKTLQEGMNDWLFLYKNADVIERSFDRIESTFLTHIVGSDIGVMQEQAITPEAIQRFMKNLHHHTNKDKELSFSSKKKVYELLQQYFRQKYIKEPYMNPMLLVTKPKDDVEKIDEELIVWDDDEIEKICKEAITPLEVGVGGYKRGAGIIFIMWIFCRIGEALALQWSDIDLENERVSISKSYSKVKIRTGPKAGKYEYKIVKTKSKKNRSFKMCRMAVDAIKLYKSVIQPKSEDEYIFSSEDGKILSENTIGAMYKNILSNTVGINNEKHVTLHGLRHTGISYFLRHGVPVEVVSRMAGHKSVQITIDIYYSVIEEQKQNAVDELNNVARMNFLGGKA